MSPKTARVLGQDQETTIRTEIDSMPIVSIRTIVDTIMRWYNYGRSYPAFERVWYAANYL